MKRTENPRERLMSSDEYMVECIRDMTLVRWKASTKGSGDQSCQEVGA